MPESKPTRIPLRSYFEIERLCPVAGSKLHIEFCSADEEVGLDFTWIDLGDGETAVEFRFVDYETEIIGNEQARHFMEGFREIEARGTNLHAEADQVVALTLEQGLEFYGAVPKPERSRDRTYENLLPRDCDSCAEPTTTGECWEEGCEAAPCQGWSGLCCRHGWAYAEDLKRRIQDVIGFARLRDGLARKHDSERYCLEATASSPTKTRYRPKHPRRAEGVSTADLDRLISERLDLLISRRGLTRRPTHQLEVEAIIRRVILLMDDHLAPAFEAYPDSTAAYNRFLELIQKELTSDPAEPFELPEGVSPATCPEAPSGGVWLSPSVCDRLVDRAEAPRWRSFAEEMPEPAEQLIWLLHLRGDHRLVLGPKKALLVTVQEASWSLWAPVEKPPIPEILPEPAVPARSEGDPRQVRGSALTPGPGDRGHGLLRLRESRHRREGDRDAADPGVEQSLIGSVIRLCL